MFGFYSNRLGCPGSLVVSVIGTIILIVLMRSCSGTVNTFDVSPPVTQSAH